MTALSILTQVPPDRRGLGPKHRAALYARGLTDGRIAADGFFTASGAPVRELLGWQLSYTSWGSGICLPYHDLEGNETGFVRFRPDHPRDDERGRPIKYENPASGGIRPFIPVGFSEVIVSAPAFAIIVEGEFKASAAVQHGVPAIGLPGVTCCFNSRPMGTHGPVGKKNTLPELARLVKKFKSSTWVLAFDSDQSIKRDVRRAQWDLARLVAAAGVSVKIVRLPHPEGGPKVGLDDWLLTHSADDLRRMVDSTPMLTREDLAGDEVLLSNYATILDGEEPVKVALSLQQIHHNWDLAGGCGWPRQADGTLFVHDGDRIVWLDNQAKFWAMIRSKGQTRWAKGHDFRGADFISTDDFYSHFLMEARAYSSVSHLPYFPARDDVYSTWVTPEGYTADGGVLARLLEFFNPDSEVDAALIRALILTAFWGGPPGARPFMVVTGSARGQQSSGKTKLALAVSELAGGSIGLRLDASKFADDLSKRITSPAYRHCRIGLFDNLVGISQSSELADLITSEKIYGRPAFGREVSRLNLLLYIGTTNDCCFSTDLATRAVIIRVAPADVDARPAWWEEVQAFIADNRAQLVADIMASLAGEKHEVTERRSRFPLWVEQVLATDSRVNEVLRRIRSDVNSVDAAADEFSLMLAELTTRCSGRDFGPGLYKFTPAEICDAFNVANRSKLTTSWVIRTLHSARARGKNAVLYPENKKHGCSWILDLGTNQGSGERNDSPAENASPSKPAFSGS